MSERERDMNWFQTCTQVRGEDKFGHLKYWTTVDNLLAGKGADGVPASAR